MACVKFIYMLALAPGSSTTIPLADGDAGIAQTIAAIAELVDAGIRDPVVNQAATQIIAHVPPHNQEAEAHAIYDWVAANIRYVPDIYDHYCPVKSRIDSTGYWGPSPSFRELVS